MYTIHCDDFVLHDPRLEIQKMIVVNPKLSLEIGKQGNLSFEIPAQHPYCKSIKKLKSRVSVLQDGEWMWGGRLLNNDPDIYLTQKCSCEGELAYLLDSVQPYAAYHNKTVRGMVETLTSIHNQQVEEDKRFTVGIVNVVDSNDSLYRYTNYENTWEVFQDKLVSRLGGYLRVRYANGIRYLDYIADYDNVNTQTIEFGKNMLSFEQSGKGEDIATVIVPLGAELETESDNSSEVKRRVTVESVNGGSIFIEDAAAVAEYGRIVATVFYDDVHDPQILKNKGIAELAIRKLFTRGITLTALDLHHLNVKVEKIKLGDMIRCIFPALGFDMFLQVTKMDIDLEDISKTVITLGKTMSTLTDNTNKNNVKANIQKVVEEYGYGQQIVNNYNVVQEVNKNFSLFQQNVNDAGYCSKEYVDRQDGNLRSLITALQNLIADANTAISDLQSLISIANGMTSLDSFSGGVAIGKTATEKGKFDVAEPALFRNGLIIKDNGTDIDVLDFIKNGGNT